MKKIKTKKVFQLGKPEIIEYYNGKNGYNIEKRRCKLCGCIQVSQTWGQHECIRKE